MMRDDRLEERAEDSFVVRPGERHVVGAEGTHIVTPGDVDDLARDDPRRVMAQDADEVSAASGADADEEEIRAEMEQTREELSLTIDAIQDRLNPQDITEDIKEHATDAAHEVIDAIHEKLTSPELKEQAKTIAQDVSEQVSAHVKEAMREATDHAKEAVRDATEQAKHAVRQATVGRVEEALWSASDTTRGVQTTMMETIKANPLPAALVGLGLGWLFMNKAERPMGGQAGTTGYRGSVSPYSGSRTAYGYAGSRAGSGYGGSTAYGYEGSRVDYRRGAGETYGGGYDSGHEEGSSGLADRVGETASHAQEQAGRLVSQAGDVASDVMSNASDTVSDVVSNAGDMVSNAGETALDAGSGVLETIKANPLPAALAGLSLGWLLFNGQSSSRSSADWSGSRGYVGSGRYAYGGGYSSGARSYGKGYEADTDEHGNPISNLAGTVGDAASQVQDKASDAVSRAGEHVGELGSQAQEQVHRAQGQLERLVQDNPLALGALALAFGAATGLAVPSTQKENELMGEARESFMDKAQTMVHDTTEKVQHVADEVTDTAKKEAQYQGLTPDAAKK